MGKYFNAKLMGRHEIKPIGERGMLHSELELERQAFNKKQVAEILPVTTAPIVPELTTKEKQRAQMAKARAARKAKQVQA